MTGKRRRFSVDAEIGEGLGEVAAQMERGAAVVDVNSEIQLNLIDLDPLQPRKLSITPNDFPFGAMIERDERGAPTGNLVDEAEKILPNGIENRAKKLAQLEDLIGLAKTIYRHGLIQFIRVQVKGNRYTLTAGERRWLSHYLLGKELIKAVIRKQPQEAVDRREVQLIENVQREGLTLNETVQALRSWRESFIEKNQRDPTGDDVREAIGWSRSHAYFLLSMVNAEGALAEAIKEDLISQTQAMQIARVKGEEDREQIVEAIRLGEKLVFPDKAQEVRKEQPRATAKAGRPRTAISLGSTKDGELVKRIITGALSVDLREEFDSIEWGDLNQAQQAWERFLKMMETA